MGKIHASSKRTQADEYSFLTWQIINLLKKLESIGNARYQDYLDAEEYRLACTLMRAAVESVSASKARQRGSRWLPPKTFRLYGRRYQLRHSNLGRVFIVTKNGVNVLGSSFFAI